MRLARDEVIETRHRPSLRFLVHASLPQLLTAAALMAWLLLARLPPWVDLLAALALTVPGGIVRSRRGRGAFPLFLVTMTGGSIGLALGAPTPWSGPAGGGAMLQLGWALGRGLVLRAQGIVVTNQGVHLRSRPWSPLGRVPHHHLDEIEIVREPWGTATLLVDTGEGYISVPGLRNAAALRDRLLVRRDQARDEVNDRAGLGRLRRLVGGGAGSSG